MEVLGIIFSVLLFINIILFILYLDKERRKKNVFPIIPESVLDSLKKEHLVELQRMEERRIKDVAEADAGAQVVFAKWKIKEEKKIRADAIKRSKEVIKGKTTEHLIPYMGDFSHNPSDCRFMGSPIDLLVFDGLSDGELKEVVFLEIKAGKHASLSKRERQLRDAIKEKRVSWKMIKKTD